MTAHTPGPWEVRTAMSLSEYMEAVPCTEARAMMPVYWHEADTTHEPIALVARVADAEVIAAAPELLEACKAVLHALESHQAYDKDFRPMLRAALAKATGGPQ